MTSLAPTVEDRTVYPEEERVGEDIVQRFIVEALRPLIARWFEERGETVFVGADQFIYFEQYNAHRRVCPDVYVLPGISPEARAPSWKTWQVGVVPSFAFEVVSTNWEKDYYDVPIVHEELGTKELVIFDPTFDQRREGVRWQRYVRNDAGVLALVDHTDVMSVDSVALGCALRLVGVGQRQRIRLVESKESLVLFPTAEEAERQAKEVEREAKEVEREAKEVALARVAELEALVAKLLQSRD
jgi:hypothetical protein